MDKYKVLISAVKGVRTLVPYTPNFYNDVMSKLESNKEEAYESLYIYNQKHYDDFQKTKTLSGIKDVTTDKIVFDFDKEGDIAAALKDARTLVARLKKDKFTDEEITPFFSSGKGFHVVLHLNATIDRPTFESIVDSYASDLETFDTSVKDQQRVFRLPMSYNNKTGLRKIPIPTESFMDVTTTIDAIKEYSLSPDFKDAKELLSSVKKVDNKFIVKEVKKNTAVTVVSTNKPDFTKNKTGLTNAKYALVEGYFEEGERHEAVMILAATFLGLGWNKELTYNNLKATLRLRARRLGLEDSSDEDKSELWREVESVYSVLWKGGMYSEDTNALLLKTKKRFNIEDKFEANAIISLSEVTNIFNDFAVNINKNTLKLGIPSFDHEIRVTSSTLVGLLAAPSAGKSSISFGILNATSNDGIRSMFFSLDMAAPQVYQRLAQRHTGMDADAMFSAYERGDKAVVEKINTVLDKEYKNVKFCFRGGISTDFIRECIIKEIEVHGTPPKLIVIDYLECITTQFSDPTVSKGYAARMLKDIANEFAVCVLLLVQPPKVAGDPSYELNSYINIKGSSTVSEACSQVFTISRPGFSPKNPEDDNYLTLTVVKNRMGKLGVFDYHWTGVTGAIRELAQEETNHLAALRKEKAEQRKDEGGL